MQSIHLCSNYLYVVFDSNLLLYNCVQLFFAELMICTFELSAFVELSFLRPVAPNDCPEKFGETTKYRERTSASMKKKFTPLLNLAGLSAETISTDQRHSIL